MPRTTSSAPSRRSTRLSLQRSSSTTKRLRCGPIGSIFSPPCARQCTSSPTSRKLGDEMKIVVLAGLEALCATPVFAAGKLPDGTYDCTLDNGYIAGSIEIDGATYKGPAFDGNYEGAYPFEVGDDYGLFLKGP